VATAGGMTAWSIVLERARKSHNPSRGSLALVVVLVAVEAVVVAARATDPVCHLSPKHAIVAALAAEQSGAPYIYRRHPAARTAAPEMAAAD
jgi:hypothetical protein